jgi:hypothetical protein
VRVVLHEYLTNSFTNASRYIFCCTNGPRTDSRQVPRLYCHGQHSDRSSFASFFDTYEACCMHYQAHVTQPHMCELAADCTTGLPNGLRGLRCCNHQHNMQGSVQLMLYCTPSSCQHQQPAHVNQPHMCELAADFTTGLPIAQRGHLGRNLQDTMPINRLTQPI